jgi:hypothetical protein
MRFREHRGGLGASLATTTEIADKAAIVRHIHEVFLWPRVAVDDITFTPYGGDDERIGWKDVHAVLLNGHIIGFVEGVPQ